MHRYALNAKEDTTCLAICVFPVLSQVVKFVQSQIPQIVQVATPNIISNPTDAISVMMQLRGVLNALVHQSALSVTLATI